MSPTLPAVIHGYYARSRAALSRPAAAVVIPIHRLEPPPRLSHPIIVGGLPQPLLVYRRFALLRTAAFRRLHAVGVFSDEVNDEWSRMERAIETEQSERTLDHAILLAMVLFLCLASYGSLGDKIAEMYEVRTPASQAAPAWPPVHQAPDVSP